MWWLLMLSLVACHGGGGGSPADEQAEPDVAPSDPTDLDSQADSPSDVDTGMATDSDGPADTATDPDTDTDPDTGTVMVADAPDLTVEAITRDLFYYRVTYCNRGTTSTLDTFQVLLTNLDSGTSFETNPLYPFSMPAPDACAETGGITCGLIDDPNCGLAIAVRAIIDPADAVDESNENNNVFGVVF